MHIKIMLMQKYAGVVGAQEVVVDLKLAIRNVAQRSYE